MYISEVRIMLFSAHITIHISRYYEELGILHTFLRITQTHLKMHTYVPQDITHIPQDITHIPQDITHMLACCMHTATVLMSLGVDMLISFVHVLTVLYILPFEE